MISGHLFAAGDKPLWDEIIARNIAAALYDLPINSSQVTVFSLALTLISGLLFATGNPWPSGVAALLFIIVRLLEHVAGELARIKPGVSSPGYYLDWFANTFSYVCLFISLATGFRDELPPALLLTITSLAVAACLVNTVIGIYQQRQKTAVTAASFPAYAGFGIDDGMYLIGPITWLGLLFHFFILSAVGAVIYTGIVVAGFIRSVDQQDLD